jgi:hypothetical protein
VIFRDALKHMSQAYPESETPEYSLRFENNSMRVHVNTSGTSLNLSPNVAFTSTQEANLTVESDMRKNTPATTDVGVSCRNSALGSYVFVVGSGSWGIYKLPPGIKGTALMLAKLPKSINPRARLHVRGECTEAASGVRLHMVVNGKSLGTTIDSSAAYPPGSAGPYIEADGGVADASYANLLIEQRTP